MLRQGLRAEPTELERSRVKEEHLLMIDGADTTQVGIKGFAAGETIIFIGIYALYELHILTVFLHNALIWLDDTITILDGYEMLGEIKMLNVVASIHWQEQ